MFDSYQSMITSLLQSIGIAFTLIGFGYFLILLVYNFNGKEEVKRDVKMDLAIIVLIVFVYSLYGVLGE